MTVRRRRAFTLIELMLAMAITVMVSTTVAGVAFALANVYSRGEDYGDALQGGRNFLLRAGTLGRQAKLVTACSSQAVVFWADDANGDNEINRDELVMLYWDRTGGRSVVRMQSVGPHANNPMLRDVVPLDKTCRLADVTTLLSQYEAYRSNVPLAEDVLDFRVTTDVPPPLTRAVLLEITLGRPERPVVLRSTVTLRADATAQVGRVGEQWVLMPPP